MREYDDNVKLLDEKKQKAYTDFLIRSVSGWVDNIRKDKEEHLLVLMGSPFFVKLIRT